MEYQFQAMTNIATEENEVEDNLTISASSRRRLTQELLYHVTTSIDP